MYVFLIIAFFHLKTFYFPAYDCEKDFHFSQPDELNERCLHDQNPPDDISLNFDLDQNTVAAPVVQVAAVAESI